MLLLSRTKVSHTAPSATKKDLKCSKLLRYKCMLVVVIMVLFYLLWTSSLRLIRNFSIVCRDLSEEKSVSSPRAWSIKKIHLIMFNFFMRSPLSHLISPFMAILIKAWRRKVSSQQAYSESFFRLWVKVSMQNHSYENVFRQQRSFSCKSNSFSLYFSKQCLVENIQVKFQKNSSVTFISEELP